MTAKILGILLLSVFVLGCMLPGATALTIDQYPLSLGEGDPVTINITDLGDGSDFTTTITEATIALEGGSSFEFLITDVTIPFGLDGASVSAVAQEVDWAELSYRKGGITYTEHVDATGDVATITASKNLESGTYDFIKVSGLAKTGETSVDIVMSLSGSTNGVPNPAEFTFGVTGAEEGSLRVTSLVDTTEYLNNQILIKKVIIFPDLAVLPTDLSGTFGYHKYVDVNGNGRLDFTDIVIYYHQMTWIGNNQPIYRFDFNDNGRIDFNDVVSHFRMI
jgi:PKD repeat protein